MSPSKPLVSVLITTYNHCDFIEKAICSALEQQTSFAFEILVGEDHSTDATPEIVSRLKQMHPDMIRILRLPANVGGHRNFAHLWACARGDFIAWLEGDDCWCDQLKLEKQVAALQADPDAVICFGQTATHYRDGTVSDPQPGTAFPRYMDFHDLVFGNFIHTPSVMYRKGVVNSYPDWLFGMPLGDFPFHLLHAQHGRILFIPEPLAIYRVHSGGAWSSRGVLEQVSKTREVLDACLGHMELTKFQKLSLMASVSRFSRKLKKLGELPREAAFETSPLVKAWGTLIRFRSRSKKMLARLA